MRAKHPILSSLMIFGVAVGSVLLFYAIGVSIVVAFFMQSDDAWWAVTFYSMAFAAIVLPIGAIAAIVKFVKTRKQADAGSDESKAQ